jgi:hypothetical protein
VTLDFAKENCGKRVPQNLMEYIVNTLLINSSSEAFERTHLFKKLKDRLPEAIQYKNGYLDKTKTFETIANMIYEGSKKEIAYFNTDGSVNVAISKDRYFVIELEKECWVLKTFKEPSYNGIDIYEKQKLAAMGIGRDDSKDKMFKDAEQEVFKTKNFTAEMTEDRKRLLSKVEAEFSTEKNNLISNVSKHYNEKINFEKNNRSKLYDKKIKFYKENEKEIFKILFKDESEERNVLQKEIIKLIKEEKTLPVDGKTKSEIINAKKEYENKITELNSKIEEIKNNITLKLKTKYRLYDTSPKNIDKIFFEIEKKDPSSSLVETNKQTTLQIENITANINELYKNKKVIIQEIRDNLLEAKTKYSSFLDSLVEEFPSEEPSKMSTLVKELKTIYSTEFVNEDEKTSALKDKYKEIYEESKTTKSKLDKLCNYLNFLDKSSDKDYDNVYADIVDFLNENKDIENKDKIWEKLNEINDRHTRYDDYDPPE